MEGPYPTEIKHEKISDQISLETGNSTHCIFDTFKELEALERIKISEKIRSLTTNTKKRLNAYLKYNDSRNGTTWSLPEGDTCEYNQ